MHVRSPRSTLLLVLFFALPPRLAAAPTLPPPPVVGRTAPDISGVDLDGHPLRLSDYRGKVVVLLFTADWCGICRSQYPYERLLLELYGNWPFAMLGVSADETRGTARQTHVDERLTYRAWWDTPERPDGVGRIAGRWGVTGWPTIYVIDGQGTIRYVDVREEDLLKAVRQLLNEQATSTVR